MKPSPMNRQSTCVNSLNAVPLSSALGTYVAKILLIGRPIPIRGCGSIPAFISGSDIDPCPLVRRQRPTCSSTVARMPRGHELAVRRAPSRESSILVALRTCENENRSEGELMVVSKRPPPFGKARVSTIYVLRWWKGPTLIRYPDSDIIVSGNDRSGYGWKI
jgi:hypothetical protein